jgi:hypothetical protein
MALINTRAMAHPVTWLPSAHMALHRYTAKASPRYANYYLASSQRLDVFSSLPNLSQLYVIYSPFLLYIMLFHCISSM